MGEVVLQLQVQKIFVAENKGLLLVVPLSILETHTTESFAVWNVSRSMKGEGEAGSHTCAERLPFWSDIRHITS